MGTDTHKYQNLDQIRKLFQYLNHESLNEVHLCLMMAKDNQIRAASVNVYLIGCCQLPLSLGRATKSKPTTARSSTSSSQTQNLF